VFAPLRLWGLLCGLLGDEGNGHWRIAPAGGIRRVRRRYQGDTLVLETTFETADGTVRVVDFMAPRMADPDVVRVVEGVRGRAPATLHPLQGPGLGGHGPAVKAVTDHGHPGPVERWRQVRDEIHAEAGPDPRYLRFENQSEDAARGAGGRG
jgi:Domain of unknown function (DUF5911)